MLSEDEIKNIEDKALEIRRTVIEMLYKAGSGHLAGSLSTADIFASFYFHILHHNPSEPLWDDRDRFILSNGHVAPARYAAMASAGYFSLKKVKGLREFGSILQGHPERTFYPALETTSGPLGLGLGQAAGIAVGAKMDGRENDFHAFCLMSDGEQDEGNTWESAMFAAKNELDNLVAIMDRNSIQISGYTHEVMPIESIKEKYSTFGWQVFEVNGHDISDIVSTSEQARSIRGAPILIIAYTTPGKGVPEIENDYRWHGRVPENHEQMERFLEEINS